MTQRNTLKTNKENRHWHRLLHLFTWEQLYFGILLFGLFPAIRDYSLTQFVGAARMDFLFGPVLESVNWVTIMVVLLLPIGLFVAISQRKKWMFIGLLPMIFILGSLFVIRFDVIGDTHILTVILAILYKLSLLVFIIKGHIRSLAFLGILVFAGVVLPWRAVVLFMVLVVLLRMIYLAITQNMEILSNIPAKKLLHLFTKTLLYWSPILLFAVPGYILSTKFNKMAKQAVYNNTLVEYHAMHTEQDVRDLMRYDVMENLVAVGLDTTGHEKSQEILWTVLQVVKFRSDSLKYADYREGMRDFEMLYKLYQQSYNPKSNYASTLFIIKHLSQDLKKVLVKRFLPDRDEFQLDIELSIDEFYTRQENAAKAEIDSVNRNFKAKIAAKINQTNQQLSSVIARSQQLQRQGTQGIEANRAALVRDTRATIATARRDANAAISEAHQSVKADIDAIPSQVNNGFEAAIPKKLTDINSGFKNEDCGFLSVSCGITNLIKGLLRDTYTRQRKTSKTWVRTEAEEVKKMANERLQKLTTTTKNKVNQTLDQSATKITTVANVGAGQASQATQQAFNEANQGIITSAGLVVDELRQIQTMADDLNKQSHEKIETGVATTKTATRKTFLSIYQAIYFSNVFSNIMLVLLVVKSFLYVFSRITFAEKNQVYIQFENTPKNHQNGVVKSHGFEYSIPPTYPERMYVVKRYFPSGRAPKIAIPLWTDSIFSRLRTGTYTMNEIEPRADATESVDFRTVRGAEFVEWTLSEGEEVIFEYKDLVAFSESLRFSSFVSFRITSMFLGRNIFRVAKGPGKLVLMTKGKPIINNEHTGKATRSVPAERVIAWQKTARFSIDTELNMADIYFSDLYLKRTSEDLVIIDADTGTIKRKVGLVRFVKRFLLPI